MRQGDTSEAFPFTCADANGPENLTTALAVVFHLSTRPKSGTTVINAAAFVTNGAAGEGEYRWAAGETDDLLGKYYAEVEVTRSDGTTRTFPNGKGEYVTIEFSEQLA
jgi:hypothetical protein